MTAAHSVAPPLPPLAPPLEPHEAYAAALASGPPPSLAPLPRPFHELATTIAGTSDVQIATGPTVRRALGAVGRRAATIGSAIHLPQAPADRPDDVAVVSHELAHVAAPSARPRFLGGRRDGEERTADRVAATARAAATGGTAGLRVGGGSAISRTVHGLVQRAVADALRNATPPAAAAAEPLPERRPEPQVVQLAPAPAPEPRIVVQRTDSVRRSDAASVAGPDGGVDLDRIVEALEERVLAELERRGGRLVEVI